MAQLVVFDGEFGPQPADVQRAFRERPGAPGAVQDRENLLRLAQREHRHQHRPPALERDPERFHEPYYRHYAIDDLDALFSAAGLEPELTSMPFLSKLMVRRKR